MSESFKGRQLAPPINRTPDPAFASAMNQAAPGVPAGAKQYPVAPITKQAHQGSLQHKRAHMHKDKAKLR